MCPKPPDIPEDGVKEYHPIPIPIEPRKFCGVNEEDMNLRCHSFLNVYIKSFVYGRNFTHRKELCDGEKDDDANAPDKDCFDDAKSLQFLAKIACHGRRGCTGKIPSIPLDEVCNGLKREARVEYLCGRNKKETDKKLKFISLFQLLVMNGTPTYGMKAASMRLLYKICGPVQRNYKV